jgi:hypothetical protein
MEEIINPLFKQRVDAHLDHLVDRFYREVPYGDHLARGKNINLEYYKRHVVEIILRLRMKRTIDALTIHYFTKHNPVLAKKWCSYTEDEMLHDAMFIKDLERLGMSREEVYGHSPLFSTKLLQGYFYYGLEHEGMPLASLASSYFIEYTSVRTQPQWIDNVERQLGAGSAKGQRSHVSHDLDDDHTYFVWNVLMTLVKTKADEERFIGHIDNVWRLFCTFFTELYHATVKPKDEAVLLAVAASS